MSEQWLKLFKDNKWAFVAYTGLSNRLNTTRWYVVQSGSWSLMRHQLESFGADSVEASALGFTASNPYNGRPPFSTIINGYVLFKPTRILNTIEKFPIELKSILNPKTLKTLDLPQVALKSDDYVMPNYFVLLVRTPLPLGGRPFVPLEEKSAYALLDHQKNLGNDVEQKIEDLKEDHKNRFHASDAETLEHHFANHSVGVTLTTVYLKPPSDYLCPECKLFGLHYKEACYLWQTTGHKEIQVAFGPKKFSSFEAPKEEDAFHYSMLYKRAKN